jgi:hypothetical protein
MRGRNVVSRLILFFLPMFLLPPVAAAQQDVIITQIGPNRTLARNQTWTNGPGGIGNNYVFKPTYAYENITFYLTSAQTVLSPSINYTVYQSGDPTTVTFTSCPSPPCVSWFEDTSGTLGVAPGTGTSLVQVSVQGAAMLTFATSIAVAGSGTASLYIVESQLTATSGSSSTPGFQMIAGGACPFGSAETSCILPPTGDNFSDTNEARLGAGGTLSVTLDGTLSYGAGEGFAIMCTYKDGAPHTLPLQCVSTSGNQFTATGDASAAFNWVSFPLPNGS